MIQDKIAIITGGAKGIGKATAEKFMNNGAHVVLIDIDKRVLDVASAFRKDGKKCYATICDLTNSEETKKAIEEIVNEVERIDILINNAGITQDSSFKKMSQDQWQKVIDVNLTGVYNCTKACIPHMIENGGGSIINASSIVGLYGNFGQTNYAATKAGVIAMAKTWARELGRYNIRSNAVAPGFIKTEMIETVPDTIITDIENKTPLNRLGTKEDIANAYLFLASDMAAFVTGTVLSVDGGLVL